MNKNEHLQANPDNAVKALNLCMQTSDVALLGRIIRLVQMKGRLSAYPDRDSVFLSYVAL
jgi:hypothetical protein